MHSLLCRSLQSTLYKRGQPEDRFIPVQLWALSHCLLADLMCYLTYFVCFFLFCSIVCVSACLLFCLSSSLFVCVSCDDLCECSHWQAVQSTSMWTFTHYICSLLLSVRVSCVVLQVTSTILSFGLSFALSLTPSFQNLFNRRTLHSEFKDH